MAEREIRTEGVYKDRAHVLRAINEREGERLGAVHNGSTGQIPRRVAGGPKGRVEWPPSFPLCRYATLSFITHLPIALALPSSPILGRETQVFV